MMKNKQTIISTIVCLLPLLLSVWLYQSLPAQIAVHFDTTGQADHYLSKAAAAFGLPVLFAALNLYSHFRMNKDPQNEKAAVSLKTLLKWLIPLLSVIIVPSTLFMSLGKGLPTALLAQVLTGAAIIICGNYLPKCKRNYTIGIKLPWTLDSEDNWNKTHRFAGFLWVIGGIVLLINAFLSLSWLIVPVILLLLAVLPVIYSCQLYQKQPKENL